jgi:hypothetical protein
MKSGSQGGRAVAIRSGTSAEDGGIGRAQIRAGMSTLLAFDAYPDQHSLSATQRDEQQSRRCAYRRLRGAST